MDNTQIPWKPWLQFLGQLLAGLGQAGEQQEWVPYGHHLHCRVRFFPFEKYASLLALVPARLHNWNSRAACRLQRKEGAPWLPFYKIQLYNKIGS